MRRILFYIVSAVTLFASISLFAEDNKLTSEQQALRSDILSFLKEEGFMPEIDTDDDIKFKSEGLSYYITISSKDENPMYVTLYTQRRYPDEYSLQNVLMASKELNRYKGVKVLCFDDFCSIRSELFLRDSELFKESFYKVLSQIKSVDSDFINECKNASSGSVAGTVSISDFPFIVTKIEVANTDEDCNIIQDYGSTIYDFKTKYLTPKITIKPFKSSGTYTFYVKLYKDNELRTGSSSPINYTYSNKITISGSSTQTFTLSGWGSKTSGFWPAATYRFEIWYGDYCIGSKTFKVI